MKSRFLKISILVLAIASFSNRLLANEVTAEIPAVGSKQIHEYGLVIMAILTLIAILASIFFYYRNRTITDESEGKVMKEAKSAPQLDKKVEGEIHAAIALALHLHNRDVHDFEKLILTMNRVSRNYSPWSSKIYSLRQWPVRK